MSPTLRKSVKLLENNSQWRAMLLSIRLAIAQTNTYYVWCMMIDEYGRYRLFFLLPTVALCTGVASLALFAASILVYRHRRLKDRQTEQFYFYYSCCYCLGSYYALFVLCSSVCGCAPKCYSMSLFCKISGIGLEETIGCVLMGFPNLISIARH